MQRPEVRTINTVAVESPFGIRYFSLRYGDITMSPDPVVVATSHSNAEVPPTGAVIRAAESRFNCDFLRCEPLITLDPAFGTFRVLDRGNFAGKELLLTRIPGLGSVKERGGDPIKTLANALWSIFGSLAALELRERELTSVAMPLLAGNRGYEVRALLSIILDQSLGWLRTSRRMGAVNLYIVDEKALDEWSSVMDDVLGRRSIDMAQHTLVNALCAEIVSLLGSIKLADFPPEWLEVFSSIRELLGLKVVPIERLAVEGRRLCELVSFRLAAKIRGQVSKMPLHEAISIVGNSKQVAPWIVSHLDCLRNFGNAAAHPASALSYEPPRLTENDMIGLMASLLRVIDFSWQQLAHGKMLAPQ